MAEHYRQHASMVEKIHQFRWTGSQERARRECLAAAAALDCLLADNPLDAAEILARRLQAVLIGTMQGTWDTAEHLETRLAVYDPAGTPAAALTQSRKQQQLFRGLGKRGG